MYTEAQDNRPQGQYAAHSPMAEQDSAAGFTHQLIVLRQFRWAIISFVGLIALLAAYYASVAIPIYRASSTILIESQKANVVSIEEFVGVDSEHEDYYLTQFEILKSRQLAERVIDELQLWDHPELSTQAFELNSLSGENPDLKDTRPLAVRFKEAVRNFSFSEFYVGVKEKFSGLVSYVTGADIPSTNQDTVIEVEAETLEQKNDDALAASESGFSSSIDEQRKRVALNRFIHRLIITPIRKTKLVRISYESAYPEVAHMVANSVGEQYIGSFLDAKQETTERTSLWLDTRLKSLKETLDLSEQKLITYKETNGLVDVNGSVGRLNEQELVLQTSELAKAQSELSSKTDILRAIRDSNNNADLLQNIPSVQANSIVQRIQIEKGVALRQFNELSNRYGELHPRIVDIKSEIASLDANLRNQIGQISRTISKERQLLSQRVATIQSNLEEGKQDIQQLGTKKIELESLEREVATNQKVYATYFNRMVEANSADGLETANAKVVDLAEIPVSPIRPQKHKIIAVSTFASLIVALALALLYDKLDRTVKSSSDIENKLRTRMLGILPVVESGFLSRKVQSPIHPLFASEHGRGFVEAVNTTKTALCIRDRQKYQQVLMVTSSVPGEGKSTISTNLAAAFGKLDKVLLIDCDLRRPSLARCAGIDRNTPGLSNLISGSTKAKHCIQRGIIEGVDLIPSGPIPDDPLEFISSPRFASILSELCRYYDRIILDCAPAQAVSDPLILSTLSDSVIYVVKSQSTTIDMAKSGLSRLREVGAPIAGVVLSQVDTARISKYAGDYYFQGYYDFYGYTDQSPKSRKQSGKIKLTPAVTSMLTEERGQGTELDFSDTLGVAHRRYRRSDPTGANVNFNYDQLHNGQNMNGQNMNGQNMNGQNMNGQNMNGQNMNGQNMNGQNMNGQNMNGQNMNGQNMNGQNMNGQNMNGHDVNEYNHDIREQHLHDDSGDDELRDPLAEVDKGLTSELDNDSKIL